MALPSSYTGSEDAVLGSILDASCAFLDRTTNTPSGGFAVQSYDEVYQGTGDHSLFLNAYPVTKIDRIASNPQPAVSITNHDPDRGVRATVQVVGTPGNPVNLNSQYTSTGLTLVRVKNAVTTTQTFTWLLYPTLTQLVAAINLVGNGWSAQVQGGLDTWSSSDLRATQGAFGSSIATSYLSVHLYDLPTFHVNENTGEVLSEQGFPKGTTYRVVFSAGYSVFPADLAEALAQLTASAFLHRNLNPNLQSESLGGYSYTTAAQQGWASLSATVKQTVNSYRRRSVPQFN